MQKQGHDGCPYFDLSKRLQDQGYEVTYGEVLLIRDFLLVDEETEDFRGTVHNIRAWDKWRDNDFVIDPIKDTIRWLKECGSHADQIAVS